MEASEGMYDVAMKPKLLRSLLREYVPDEKHRFSNPSELSYVVSAVQTHKLLSEWAPHPAQPDLSEAWKSAVDSWVNRLLTLASSDLPDKRWAGICLLGLTCQECSSERFLTSYAVWLEKLMSRFQLPEVCNFVKVAACASLSDMFTRLSGFSSAKKDGTSQATKVIQPALKLLNEDSTDVVLEEVICLLCTMINFFPLSVNRHYDNVEAAIVLKIVSGKCCVSVLKKLAHTLSLLPKSRGDEDSWSLMMDKILLHMNNQMNDAFQGLEEESRSTQTLRALLPSGKEPPLPLGGLSMSERTSDLLNRRPERILGSGISTLMQCCRDMLTSSYPVVVPVPVYGLIALSGRVLMVDGSLSSSSYSFMSTLKQEFICSEIPLLQLHSLEILAAIVKTLSSQLLPHAAGIVRMLKEYLKTCKFPDLKIKAYSILKIVLMSMGTGTAIHINQDIIDNVCIDLDYLGEKDVKSSGTQTKSLQKKRKHSLMANSSQEQPAHDNLEVETSHNLTPISVKIAALETLEALLTMGGSMRSEGWRGNVDHILITVAINAFKGGWSRDDKNIFLYGDHNPMWADFQLAALRALLASLLSLGWTRPSNLGLSLELFHRGMQETGTKLGEFCGHALLALEVLIHPRALPLSDSGGNEYKFLSQKSLDSITKIGKVPDEPESEDDDLNENWFEHDNETEAHITNYTEKPIRGARDPSVDKFPSVEVATVNLVPGNNKMAVDDRDGHAHITNYTPKSIVSTRDLSVDENPSAEVATVNLLPGNNEMAVDDGDVNVLSVSAASAGVASVETEVTLKSSVVSKVSKVSTSMSEHAPEITNNESDAAILERISAMFHSDSESDDSIPDIIIGDPDSD